MTKDQIASTGNKPRMNSWLVEPLPADVRSSLERLAEADDVQHIAVLPDVHLAEQVCVGVALATNRLIYPAAVGSDIGCGMAAIRFDADADLLADEKRAASLLAGLCRTVPTLKHNARSTADALPQSLLKCPLSHPRLERLKAREARIQLGSLGRGNHFLEFQRDEQDQLWLMIHSGSRSMGQAITAHHRPESSVPQAESRLLDVDAETTAGRAYLTDVAWAICYAAENRRAMVVTTCQLMDRLFGVTADADSFIDCHHNHVQRETHFGKPYWVHRKGALPADDNLRGLIPGSMGTPSFHVTGRGCADSLRSSSHGSGRALSRRAAAQLITRRQFERELRGVWFDHRRIDALRDESPSAYKDIVAVLRAQHDLVRIERRLQPILSYKGT
jgi:tRNA-splicing ligase RtcB (3'-phosphate/5'-hydroxy nucleic acid ligase)